MKGGSAWASADSIQALLDPTPGQMKGLHPHCINQCWLLSLIGNSGEADNSQMIGSSSASDVTAAAMGRGGHFTAVEIRAPQGARAYP